MRPEDHEMEIEPRPDPETPARWDAEQGRWIEPEEEGIDEEPTKPPK